MLTALLFVILLFLAGGVLMYIIARIFDKPGPRDEERKKEDR